VQLLGKQWREASPLVFSFENNFPKSNSEGAMDKFDLNNQQLALRKQFI